MAHLKINEHIPQRLLKDIIYSEFVVIRPNKSHHLVALTKSLNFFELKNKEILSSCPLDQTSSKSTIDNLPEEMEIDETSLTDYIQIIVFYVYQVTSKRIFFLIKIKTRLYVVEKTIACLELKCNYHDIKSVKIIDEAHNGNPIVCMTRLNKSMIKTNFCGDNAKTSDKIVQFKPLKSVISNLENKKRALQSELATQRLMTQKIFYKLENELKFGPETIKDGNPDERSPLVRYGDLWIRMHNELIIIGVPVLNCTYTRRRVAQNVRASLVTHQLDQFEYKCQLFKLKNDSYTFENFHELLDDDNDDDKNQSMGDNINFNDEWKHCQKNVLHPEMAAVIVITIKLMSFVTHSSYTLQCFVLYDVTHEDQVYPLQLYAGVVEIPIAILYDDIYQPTLSNSTSIYRDLLAITSTSLMTALKIKFENNKNVSFDQFIVTKMNFIKITNSSHAAHSFMSNDFMAMDNVRFDRNQITSDIFYHKEGFWRGTVIRLQQMDNDFLYLKLYSRTQHQTICFLRAIMMDYDETCKITRIFSNATKLDLVQSLLNELNFIKNIHEANSQNSLGPEDIFKMLSEKFLYEYNTDLVFYNSS